MAELWAPRGRDHSPAGDRGGAGKGAGASLHMSRPSEASDPARAVPLKLVIAAFAELDSKGDGILDRRELYRSLRSSASAQKLFEVQGSVQALTKDALRGLIEGIIYDVAQVSQQHAGSDEPVAGVDWPSFLAYFCQRRGVVFSFEAPLSGSARPGQAAVVRLVVHPHRAELLGVGKRAASDVAASAPGTSLLRGASTPLGKVHSAHYGQRVFQALSRAGPGSPYPKRGKFTSVAAKEASMMLNGLVTGGAEASRLTDGSRSPRAMAEPSQDVRVGLFSEAFVAQFDFEASGRAEMSMAAGDVVVRGPNPRLSLVGEEAAVPDGWLHVFKVRLPRRLPRGFSAVSILPRLACPDRSQPLRPRSSVTGHVRAAGMLLLHSICQHLCPNLFCLADPGARRNGGRARLCPQQLPEPRSPALALSVCDKDRRLAIVAPTRV